MKETECSGSRSSAKERHQSSQSELNIMDATEIFAHELAHVAAGEGAGHGERWDEEFQRIFDEYNRIGKERFGEDGKEIETAPEYREEQEDNGEENE